MRLGMRLLVFGYPLAELIAAILVASWVGWGWTILLVLAGIPAGLAIMRNAGESSFRTMREAARTGALPENAGSPAMRFVAGLLIAVPGFLTDIVGLVLLLPPVQRLVAKRLGARVVVAGGGTAFAPGDVVSGTVIVEDDATGTGTAASSDETVIRGIIVNPPDEPPAPR